MKGETMPTEFVGTGLPLDQEGLTEVVDKMGAKVAEIWAILEVETQGCGFLADRRPFILFERHTFSKETKHRYDADYPDISNRKSGGYGAGGAAQYDRLARATSLDRTAALRSASWGIGQLMGFNAKIAGYTDVEQMVIAMMQSEKQQLLGMAGEIIHNSLDIALRAHDWASFARGYNGPAYAKNKYDTRLAAAYQKYALGPLPDLTVRASQVYLSYLGYDPGTIDGMMGPDTRSALNKFQTQHGLPLTDDISDANIAVLRQEVEKLGI